MSAKKKQTFPRFRDLRWLDINCDLHVHTDRTDGKSDITVLMDSAVERGLKRIAFTEHARRDTRWFHEFACEVRARQEGYPQLEVLVGCEVKAIDMQGGLDATDEILAESDIVLGSVHRFPNGRGEYIDFSTLSQEEHAQIELELALGLLRAAPIDVLAHPGGMYCRRYSDFPSAMMREILEASLERGRAVEINTSYLQDLSTFLKLCTEINPYVSIGSDAHQYEQLGECRELLQAYGIGSS